MPQKVLGVKQRLNKFSNNHLAIKSKTSHCIIWKTHNAEFLRQQPEKGVGLDHILETKDLKIS